MAATTPAGTTPYYFIPSPSRFPAQTALGLFFVILGAGQWVNGVGWGAYSLLLGMALYRSGFFTGGWPRARLWQLAGAGLAVGLPLALWLSLTVMRRAPWALHDVVRADGATRWQQLRLFALPVLGPGLALVTAVVFVVVSQDVVVGAALTTSDGARPLPATLLLGEAPPSVVAAAGLFWLVPALLVLVVAPRRTALLVGRTTR